MLDHTRDPNALHLHYTLTSQRLAQHQKYPRQAARLILGNWIRERLRGNEPCNGREVRFISDQILPIIERALREQRDLSRPTKRAVHRLVRLAEGRLHDPLLN